MRAALFGSNMICQLFEAIAKSGRVSFLPESKTAFRVKIWGDILPALVMAFFGSNEGMPYSYSSTVATSRLSKLTVSSSVVELGGIAPVTMISCLSVKRLREKKLV